LAQPCSLLHHGVAFALLFDLQGRFALLSLAEHGFGITTRRADAAGKFVHLGSPEKDTRETFGRASAPRAVESDVPRRPRDPDHAFAEFWPVAFGFAAWTTDVCGRAEDGLACGCQPSAPVTRRFAACCRFPLDLAAWGLGP